MSQFPYVAREAAFWPEFEAWLAGERAMFLEAMLSPQMDHDRTQFLRGQVAMIDAVVLGLERVRREAEVMASEGGVDSGGDFGQGLVP